VSVITTAARYTENSSAGARHCCWHPVGGGLSFSSPSHRDDESEEMRPLSLSDDQLSQLRATAATLPVEQRGDLLKLLAGYLEFEGDLASAAAFNRAVSFALDALHSHRDAV